MSRFMAHPVHATPQPEPEPSLAYRAVEFAVFVAGIAVVLYVLLIWLPQ